MAEVHLSADTPGHSPRPRGWSNVASSTSSKLRDSCHACAASKVKCSKEKPTCARCVKRGTTCEYLVTKRPGRKHDSRVVHRNLHRSGVARSLNEFAWPAALSGPSSGNSTPPDVAQHSPTNEESMANVSSDMFPNLLSPVDNSLSSVLGPMDIDFDELFPPPLSFPEHSLPDLHVTDPPNLFTGSESSNSTSQGSSVTDGCIAYSSAEEAIFFFGTLEPNAHPPSEPDFPMVLERHPQNAPSVTSRCSRASSTKPNSTTHTRPYQDTRESGFSCGCLIRALDLLKPLLAEHLLPRMENMSRNSQLGNFHTIKSVNKQTIDALAQILKCSCAAESYLLTIASLIVFKILNWYAQVARTSITTPPHRSPHLKDTDTLSLLSSSFSRRFDHDIPTATGTLDGIDGEDTGRITAQLVLGELHLVQCLVNQLAPKLKACIPRPGFEKGHVAMDSITSSNNDLGLAFSTPMLSQLETELRSRTSSLASEIIGLLRQD
ncbi:hypothetical protein K491DRAFT_722526 [Lophiostoma macrostomum CBS 122681]|uniref:Zn(2)-C6 fungal-type domain-containing protein n=1 Tax=Lophiostoma macrostomum CBS 122681 TaxID=1314788 RepID=A0A6A6SNF1_9PLEO|nr:hypothetical protein K491DRAFT_722526 [Lophiostoma macrostomum CBS 122681]